MRFDPAIRLAKYESVMGILRQNGFTVSVTTESNRVDGMGVAHAHCSDFRLFICSRLRGWFIHVPRGGNRLPAIFQIPYQDTISPLLGALLESPSPLINLPSNLIEHQFGLRVVPYSTWTEDERQEEAQRWSHFGWRALPEEELQEIAPRYEILFFPEGKLSLPSPSSSWRLSGLTQLSTEQQEEVEMAITMHALGSFRQCVSYGEELLVLDWKHTCYRLNVHQGIHNAYRDEWAKPILSSGDDVVFLAPDFRFGLLSLGDASLHVFGDSFVEAFLHDLPAPRVLLTGSGL